jgi:predicted RNA-binding protein (virulence factor B family)
MVKIGKINTLRIIKKVDFGLYLDGGESGEILLPERYVPTEYTLETNLDVFIYCDSEDRLIATTETPHAQVGEFAYLTVVSITSFGAFLDWGLAKDLFVPFKEQQKRMQKGESYLVRVYLDESNRIAASSHLGRFLNKTGHTFSAGERVTLLIWEQTDLGYKAIINDSHTGLILKSDLFQILKPGERLPGRIKFVRPDGKIDLMLDSSRYETVGNLSDTILAALQKEGGFVALNDKSTPEKIAELFGVSKKTFKQAIGALYKKRLITITDDGIRLV